MFSKIVCSLYIAARNETHFLIGRNCRDASERVKAKLNIAPGVTVSRTRRNGEEERNSKPIENCFRETNFQGCFHRPRAVFSDIDSPSSPSSSSSFLSLYILSDSSLFHHRSRINRGKKKKEKDIGGCIFVLRWKKKTAAK